MNKKYYCIDCRKKLSHYHSPKRCKGCSGKMHSKRMKELWINKKFYKKMVKIHKNKRHTKEAKEKMSKSHKGKKYPGKGMKGENNPAKRPEVREKLRKSIVKHHVYLRKNSNRTIKLNRSLHRKLHQNAYEYIYHKYGKKGIDDYIKWFKKKYKIKRYLK